MYKKTMYVQCYETNLNVSNKFNEKCRFQMEFEVNMEDVHVSNWFFKKYVSF